jgi:hypothetical protein
MVTYPIYVNRATYRGADKRKRQQAADYSSDASLLEDFCNALLEKQTAAIQTYDWWDISRGCGLSLDRVAELGYSIAGGSNGFTAARRGLSPAQAIEASKREADEPV